MTFFLFRRPSTMEDEGRHTYCGARPSLADAQRFRDDLVAKSDGYYGAGDFAIAETVTGSECTCLTGLEDDAYDPGGPLSGQKRPPRCTIHPDQMGKMRR